MTRMRGNNQDDIFSRESIRQAFRRMHSPAKLASHKLCELKIVELKRRETKRGKDKTDLARSLRDVLREALKAASERAEAKTKNGLKYIELQYISGRIIQGEFQVASSIEINFSP
jgi:hypothetical protein